jgi:hypothetical protein
MRDTAFEGAERGDVRRRRIGRGDDAGDAAHQAPRTDGVGQRLDMTPRM